MPIVGTTVATAILGVGASGTIAFGAIAATTDLALGIGLQLAANALTKKPATTTGTSLQIQTGGVVPRSLLFGHSVTAGSLVYANVWGKANKTPNAYLTMVVALADKRIGTPTNLWINDTLCAWPDMSGTAPYAQGWPLSEFATGSNNRAWVRFYDGSQSAADSFLTSTFGADAHYPWDSTAVGAGVAYAVLTFQFDPQYFSGSIPTVKFVTPGCYWYDPRKDSTVGGSGSQVWSDETTWTPTNNPAVHLYNILRGVSYGGKWMYGLQDMVAARLPLDSWFAAMNECDVAITQAGGGTLPQYQAGGEVSLDTKPADAVNALLTACAGRLSEVAGVYKLHVGAPGTAVLSFGDADIISTEAQTYTPFPSITSTINAITGKYPEPVSAWASTDAPPLYNPDYETADGNRELPQSVSYDMVPYKEQVQRLMKSALAEARRFRQATYVLPAWARCLEPGDFVSVTDSRNGFDVKLFRVDDLKYMSTLDVTVTLTEVDPSDYDWNPAADYTPVVPVPPQIVLPTAQLMSGWNADKATIVDNDGVTRRPAIKLFYDGDLTDVQFVRAQVRLAGATDLQFDGTTPYGDPATNSASESVIISFASILPNIAYEVRGIYLPYSSRTTLWSNETESGGVITEGAWLTVTTPDVRFGAADIYPITPDQLGAELQILNDWIADDLGNQLAETARNAADSARDTLDGLLAATLGGAEAALLGYANHASLARTVDASVGDLTAQYKELITAYTDADAAEVAKREILSTALTGASDPSGLTLATVSGLVGSERDTRISATESLQTLIDGLTGEINDPTTGNTALGSAIDQLTNDVSTANGSIHTASDALRTLHDEQSGASLAQVEAALLGFKGRADDASAQADVNQLMSSRIDTNAAGIALNGSIINSVKLSLSGYATVGVTSYLQGQITANAGGISANADALTSVQSTVGNFSAGGLFRATAVTTSAGASATVGLGAVATSGSGPPTTAAILLDAMSDGTSRATILADQAMVMDSSGNLAALFQAGTTYINHEVVGLLESADGKMVADFVNKFISISD